MVPYQENARDAVLAHVRAQMHNVDTIRALMVIADGLDHYTVVASMVEQLWAMPDITEKGGGVLFLCHDNKILSEALTCMRSVPLAGMTYGIYSGSPKSASCDVLFSTFQMMRRRKYQFDPDEFMVVIVDRSHRSYAKTFKSVIDYFTPRVLLGMTPTPDRMDQQDIRKIFGKEALCIHLAQGVANGWLTQVRYEQVIYSSGKTLADLSDKKIAQQISSYQRRGIVFCENIDHARELVTRLKGAVMYHSGRKPADNKRALTRFQSGEASYLLVVDMLNGGVAMPDASLVVFLRATYSRTIFLQQLGLTLGRLPDKEDVVVLDFVGNCEHVHVDTTNVPSKVRETAKVDGKVSKASRAPLQTRVVDISTVVDAMFSRT